MTIAVDMALNPNTHSLRVVGNQVEHDVLGLKAGLSASPGGGRVRTVTATTGREHHQETHQQIRYTIDVHICL